MLYFQALSKQSDIGKESEESVEFTELREQEVIGVYSEMLRVSFRICFGILDKIATGICELFDLAGPKENIYFENFWRPRGNNLSKKQKERWDRINNIKNYSLMALFSQATELNTVNGEFGHMKTWRNSLEHGMLILVDSLEEKDSPFVFPNVKVVSYALFKSQTLQLLQFVRSAIFNFAFCVRQEGLKATSDATKKITLDFKN